jgi:hypothetical protein
MYRKVLLVVILAVYVIWADIDWSAPSITITNEAQLRELAALVNSGERNFVEQTIVLNNSINIESDHSNQWTPIGTYENPFAGTFNGNNRRIQGIFAERLTVNYQGLFGVVGTNGTISNLMIDNVDITGNAYLGALVGLNLGNIVNIRTGSNNISVKSNNADVSEVGLLVGKNVGRVSGYLIHAGDMSAVGINADGAISQGRQASAEPVQQRQPEVQGVFADVLRNIGLPRYIPMFVQHRVTDEKLIASLTSEELSEIGVDLVGDRHRIIQAFAQYAQAQENNAEQNIVAAEVLTHAEQNFAAYQKSNHNLNFGFLYDWERGMGTSFSWDMGFGNMFSFGLGVDYSTETFMDWQYKYITPNARFAFHLFSIPQLRQMQSLSRLDLYLMTRMGVEVTVWNYGEMGGRADFMLSMTTLGWRFNLNRGVYLWTEFDFNGSFSEFDVGSLSMGLGFRF